MPLSSTPHKRKAPLLICPHCEHKIIPRTSNKKNFCNKCNKWFRISDDKLPEIKRCKCKRCGKEWTPRKATMPVMCSKCKNRYWNKPYVRPPEHGVRLQHTRHFEKYIAEHPNYQTPENADYPHRASYFPEGSL